MTPQEFEAVLAPVAARVRERSLDASLELDLNAEFGPRSGTYAAIREACHAAIAEGWMCDREGGGIRYGRVIKPADSLGGLSVDVVDMDTIRGPHHRHPNGEIDLVMPITPEAKFDGRGAGWLVYGPGTAHYPTVTEGRALVLYLLPGGAIEFTKT
ncbi:MAG: DUF4863 family protein [Burkholderiales bacterium]|jgi:hypothetical protein|nr:DUF4863 family protein [Burkholderiales bacterium]